MIFKTYCNGACNESDLCQYQDICSAELIETTTCYDNEHLRKSFATGFEFNKKDCIRDCGGTLLMPEISEQIKAKAEVIANIILSGKHVELCENKDGLRIISLDRKVEK